ncbi:hypothetical protein BVG00_21250 [Bacillus cereus]|nr:hypothetical protein BVG00_21250 [Bacillus cereus]
MDGSPIHIIKIRMVQVGRRHLWVSFFIVVQPHAHQLKNSELPQNEKKNFLLQINTKFRSGDDHE